MKLQPDRVASQNVISGYATGSVTIADRTWRESLLLPFQGDPVAWQVPHFEALSRDHFDRVLSMAPEIVLFGSGARLRFPKPEWLQGFMQHRIGLETMDTAAACRTYNLLLAEGRSVVAALLIETD